MDGRARARGEAVWASRKWEEKATPARPAATTADRWLIISEKWSTNGRGRATLDFLISVGQKEYVYNKKERNVCGILGTFVACIENPKVEEQSEVKIK